MRSFVSTTFLSLIGLGACYLWGSYAVAVAHARDAFPGPRAFITRTAAYRFVNELATFVHLDVINRRVVANVHLGKDRFLFYVAKLDGDVWNDMYHRETAHDADILLAWRRYLRQYDGLPYYLIVVPNRERVLADRLNLYVAPESSDSAGLLDRFRDTTEDSRVVSFPDSTWRNGTLFYSADTHWNLMGARLAVLEALRRAGGHDRAMEAMQALKPVATLHTNDIPPMINGRLFRFYPDESIEQDLLPASVTAVRDGARETFRNPRAVSSKRVLVFGDSFRKPVALLLTNGFAEVVSIYKAPLAAPPPVSGDFDVTMEIRAERYFRKGP